MSITEILEKSADALQSYFVFANTPAYLFRHYRRNPAVQVLGSQCRVEELVAEIESLKDEPPTVDVAVRLYALLVAITLSADPAARDTVRALSCPSLSWFEDIKRIFLASGMPTTSREERGVWGSRAVSELSRSLDNVDFQAVAFKPRTHVENQPI